MNFLIDTIVCMIGFFISLHAVRRRTVQAYSEALPYLFGMLGWVTFGVLSFSNYLPITSIVGDDHNHSNVSIFWLYTFARFMLLIGWYFLVRKTLRACKIKNGSKKCRILKASN
jgi:hypothetical protein